MNSPLRLGMPSAFCCGIVLLLLSATLFAATQLQVNGYEMVGLSAGGSIFQGNCSPHDPNILTVATDMGAALITYDRGASWRTIHFRQLWSSHSAAAAFHPRNPDVIYWVNGSELRVSRDRGATWSPVSKWQPWRKEGGRINRIWLDPDYPQWIFVGVTTTDGGKTYLSRNAGKEWEECRGVPGVLFRVAVERKSPADRRVYFLGTSKGVFRSDNNGKNFVKKVKGLSQETLTGFAGGSNEKSTILYVTVPCSLQDGLLTGGVFRSKDRGETWQRCMNAKINRQTMRSSKYAQGDLPHYSTLVTNDAMPERAFVYCDGTSYFPPNHATVYRTDNSGEAWQEVFFSDPRFHGADAQCNVETDYQTELWGQREQGNLRGLEINPVNPDKVVITQGPFIHYTTDAGKTWLSPYRGSFRIDAKGNKHWATTGEAVTSTWNYYIDPFDKKRHYICYTDIGFARSLDGGKYWLPEMYNLQKYLPQGWANTCYELAFDPDVKGRIWGAFSAKHDIPNYNAVYNGEGFNNRGGIAVSSDHGATWRKLKLPAEGPAMSVVVDPGSPRNSRTLYASMFAKGVYRSTDDGLTWEPKNNGLDPDGPKRCLKLLLHRDGTLFVATTGAYKYSPSGTGIYRSRDKGESWTKITTGQPWDWIRDFTVKPDDSQTILVPTSRVDPGLHRTTNGGTTWETIYASKKQAYFFGAAYHPDRNGWIYLTLGEEAEKSGIYLSTNDGRTWKPFPKVPFPGIQRVAFDQADPGHIYLSTFGSSIIKAPSVP